MTGKQPHSKGWGFFVAAAAVALKQENETMMATKLTTKIEYQVRPITRWVVTKYVESESINGKGCASSEERGTYDNASVAFEVASALCKRDHEATGWPVGDNRIIYPQMPSQPIYPRGHASSCAVHNMPAEPAGPCDCGYQESAP